MPRLAMLTVCIFALVSSANSAVALQATLKCSLKDDKGTEHGAYISVDEDSWGTVDLKDTSKVELMSGPVVLEPAQILLYQFKESGPTLTINRSTLEIELLATAIPLKGKCEKAQFLPVRKL